MDAVLGLRFRVGSVRVDAGGEGARARGERSKTHAGSKVSTMRL